MASLSVSLRHLRCPFQHQHAGPIPASTARNHISHHNNKKNKNKNKKNNNNTKNNNKNNNYNNTNNKNNNNNNHITSIAEKALAIMKNGWPALLEIWGLR
ncbi:unnamed protein product [Polarella glacialis]|uniref:Uncharacterized protein n=1 Tax=Polarella glacialis TaxID=89957 RepID=A0A813IUH1_POLGL|nr:unnamed protein product [Polarella glacialis]